MVFFRLFLLPFALLYGMAVFFRNMLFDIGLLPSKQFPVPVISVGNLRTGGTGKTPHAEYLIRLLKDKYRVALLSRGYKRKSKGFKIAGPDSGINDIGDEPLQMHKKFPGIVVAVHEKRSKGIKLILQKFPDVDVVILDDAFQHRYVKPGLNLLLTGYYKPFFDDFLLPVGNLREAKCRAKRADALIVTKTPQVFSPLDRRFFLKKLKKYKLEPVFFSTFRYLDLKPMTTEAKNMEPDSIKSIFLLTGIANTTALEEQLKTKCSELYVHNYRDHHQFTGKNLKDLRNHFDKTISFSKIIVTTEKDAMRLQHPKLLEQLTRLPVFYLPVEVAFHDSDKQKFDKMVFDFLARHGKVAPAPMK